MSRMSGEVESTTPQREKEWTLMFFFASDNSLASTIVSQLKALKDAGHHPQVNVVAHFDPHVVNTPSQVFDINLVEKIRAKGKPHIGQTRNDPYVRNLVLDKLWGENEKEMRFIVKKFAESPLEAGKPPDPAVKYDAPTPCKGLSEEESPKQSLADFLAFCCQKYPARHYMLVILGHGEIIGNKTFLLDDNTDKEAYMTLQDLGCILKTFSKEAAPGKLEMVGFHSCSMSSVEVAFELAGTATYMLASQGPAYVGSWPYKSLLIRLFNDLKKHVNLDYDAIKEQIRKIFSYCFFNSQDFQLAGYSFDVAMVDLDRVADTKEAISNLAQQLKEALTSEPLITKDLIRLAHLDSQSFSSENYTDLYDFCWCLEDQCKNSTNSEHEVVVRIKDVCEKTRTALRSYLHQRGANPLVVASAFAGPAFQYSHGLSVLFPWKEPVGTEPWYKEYSKSKFDYQTKWGNFLQTYFEKTMRHTRATEFQNRFPSKDTNVDDSLSGRLLQMLDELAAKGAFVGQLAKPGPDHPMGKWGPDDPSGAACSCSSIKNYPRST